MAIGLKNNLFILFFFLQKQGLAAMWASWTRYTCHENLPRFAHLCKERYGSIEGMTTLEAAEAGIKAMERFFASIGMPTDIHTLIGKEVTDAQIEEMAQKCTNNDSITIGALKVLHASDIIAIYKMAR